MNRRGFIAGLGSLLAAPAIVPFASLMPVHRVLWPPANRIVYRVSLLQELFDNAGQRLPDRLTEIARGEDYISNDGVHHIKLPPNLPDSAELMVEYDDPRDWRTRSTVMLRSLHA